MKTQGREDAVLSVAQWSLDHSVLTLPLIRNGPVHKRHAKMLNRYFRLLYSGLKSKRVWFVRYCTLQLPDNVTSRKEGAP